MKGKADLDKAEQNDRSFCPALRTKMLTQSDL